ncbi:hypothetical protein QA584_21260 [Anaerocolumna sp. AGMB13025]|uniref:hypothetical protein n=1 Tax=Anaerocolumna sp. AGMB13025 TaxID=3039116 RepID=UPI00241EDC1E|nr:hypothetical protein [Anaerocolumna sp. AGMB13025]WFR56122.1 hypothetical protein QA584_21260 [Anaerocolumna sp. AGMB13025]
MDYIKVKNYVRYDFDVNEMGKYYILRFDNDEQYKVSEMAETIIQKFDGQQNNNEIIASLNKENIIITIDEINDFIKTFLMKNNMIEGTDEALNAESRLWFHMPIVKGKRIEPVLKLFGNLCNARIMVAQVFFLFYFNLYIYSPEIT